MRGVYLSCKKTILSSYDTLSISFQNGIAWSKNILSIKIQPDTGEVFLKDVKNIFSKLCFSENMIHDYVTTIKPVVLIETAISPNDKEIHLAGHKGTQLLQIFWNILKNSTYVVSARSTEFTHYKSEFIVKIEPDKKTGVVIIAPNNQHYTLWVQTTGRNYHETKRIAEELQKNYA